MYSLLVTLFTLHLSHCYMFSFVDNSMHAVQQAFYFQLNLIHGVHENVSPLYIFAFCLYDDLCYIICTVLRGRYRVIQRSCCNTNKTIIKLRKNPYYITSKSIKSVTSTEDGISSNQIVVIYKPQVDCHWSTQSAGSNLQVIDILDNLPVSQYTYYCTTLCRHLYTA